MEFARIRESQPSRANLGTRVASACTEFPVQASPSAILGFFILLAPATTFAGGPRFVAGTAYFNPSVVGEPVHWAGGVVNYYVDQGPLNSQISNAQATAMVDAAAALWSAIPTAGVVLSDAGQLNEDVNGANVIAGNQVFAQPTDVAPSATSYPLAIVYDSDGSVINALFGAGSSDPTSCQNNGVLPWLDNIQPDATIGHAVILLNGLCATNTNLVEMMQYELERAFGRILGLDYSQVNPAALNNSGEPDGMFGWPVMHPLSGVCGAAGGICIPNPGQLRYDDIAALNRIYPITAANAASFPGKQITAASTVSMRGTINFRTGAGMQGVNVVARPLDSNGNPLYQYTVTAVSGALFSGNRGNPITGWVDQNANPLAMWGSNDPTLQGSFDLSGIPLPPGMTSASYQVTFEAINPLYMLTESVGPYVDGSPTPSGTTPVLLVPNLAAGSAQTLTVTVADSAAGGSSDAIASAAAPRILAPSGLWCGRLSQVGQTDWFDFPVRAGHTFTVVTQALNELGLPTESKALPVIGVWDAFDTVSAPSAGWAPPLNGYATGETWLQITADSDDIVRLGIADMRGDGRPDYSYNGWLLYADTVQPQRLPMSGGPIVIQGMGFRPSDTVSVAGQRAVVTSISPNEITAIAPAAASGVSGSVDVEVDDLPSFYAMTIISGGLSYDSGGGDSLTLKTAPANTVPIGVPIPFTVVALGPDLSPAGGVTVNYAVASGNATLGCGASTCSVVATGDGIATMSITAPTSGASVVTASLTNGATLQAHFTGGTPPVLDALTPNLSVAAGVTVNWITQALALSNGAPSPGQTVTWQSSLGIAPVGTSSGTTNTAGIATKTLTVGPLNEGQQVTSAACLNGTSQCVNFVALGARPEYAWLEAVAGTSQTLAASATPSQILLRLHDMNGNPMAGGTVTLYEAVYQWAPPCPPHGRCAQPNLLATQTATATSALDGSVSFSPASIPGVATSLVGLAVTGNASALGISIEQHP